MKLVGIIIVIWLISACSTTKVHLYTRYLSEAETNEVTKNLQRLGFDVIPNTLMFPKTVEQSTLLYSPFVEGEDTVDNLIASMQESGWFIANIQAISAGNHYYTNNSLGLLLLPEGAKRDEQVHRQDMFNDYLSKDCNVELRLTLNSDASYQFSYLNEQASRLSNEQEQWQGHWQITSYPYIELVSSKKYRRFYYEIQTTRATDLVGKINLIELKPIDDHYSLPQCSFYYGLRQ